MLPITLIKQAMSVLFSPMPKGTCTTGVKGACSSTVVCNAGKLTTHGLSTLPHSGARLQTLWLISPPTPKMGAPFGFVSCASAATENHPDTTHMRQPKG